MDLAIVTGANRGIGLETCRQLGQRGMRVILTARDLARAETAAAGLTAEGIAVEARWLDVADARSVEAFAARLRDEHSVVTVLVNNAAVSLSGFDASVAARTLGCNYFGTATVTAALAPAMAAGGRIVVVSSGMGELRGVSAELRARLLAPDLDREGLDALMNEFVAAVRGRHRDAGWPSNAYSVSKVGVNALVRILAEPLSRQGLLINAVCPGWVRSEMGGRGAPRSLEQGAASVVWGATLPPDGPRGGFFRDGRAIAW
jgi:NAD(P)-dependent dehydrogenase (short-subunit alcohol dehydrogenase family)